VSETRLEILKLAMASTNDAKLALHLARDMVAFIEGEPTASLKTPEVVPEQSEPTNKELEPARTRRSWTLYDKTSAATMLDEGKSYEDVAAALQRTVGGVMKARAIGLIPCKVHQMNEGRRISGLRRALNQGQNLGPSAQDILGLLNSKT